MFEPVTYIPLSELGEWYRRSLTDANTTVEVLAKRIDQEPINSLLHAALMSAVLQKPDVPEKGVIVLPHKDHRSHTLEYLACAEQEGVLDQFVRNLVTAFQWTVLDKRSRNDGAGFFLQALKGGYIVSKIDEMLRKAADHPGEQFPDFDNHPAVIGALQLRPAYMRYQRTLRIDPHDEPVENGRTVAQAALLRELGNAYSPEEIDSLYEMLKGEPGYRFTEHEQTAWPGDALVLWMGKVDVIEITRALIDFVNLRVTDDKPYV